MRRVGIEIGYSETSIDSPLECSITASTQLGAFLCSRLVALS